MKNLISIFLINIGVMNIHAQVNIFNKYQSPNKQSNFSQLDWLEIMSEIANDTGALNGMKGFTPQPIEVSHLPYACYVNFEHQILLHFCPECVWIVDSCTSTYAIASISITAQEPYGFHHDRVITQDVWNTGDTLQGLLFILHSQPSNQNELKGFLIPVATNVRVPAYPVFPNKNKKR